MKYLITAIVTLFIFTSCTNFDEQITISKKSVEYIYGIDGIPAEFMRHSDNFDSMDVVSDDAEGKLFIRSSKELLTAENMDVITVDTIGDTVIYVRPVYISTGDSSDIFARLALFSKLYTSTIVAPFPVVWTNADLVDDSTVRYSKRIFNMTMSDSEEFITVKCLMKGEPNRLKMKTEIAKAKVKNFFLQSVDKIRNWFSDLILRRETKRLAKETEEKRDEVKTE